MKSSAVRRAKDQDPDISFDTLTIESVVNFLRSNLSPEKFAELTAFLARNKSSEAAAPETAKDAPADFPGKPKTGGEMAADARPLSYRERFPGAARITQAF